VEQVKTDTSEYCDKFELIAGLPAGSLDFNFGRCIAPGPLAADLNGLNGTNDTVLQVQDSLEPVVRLLAQPRLLEIGEHVGVASQHFLAAFGRELAGELLDPLTRLLHRTRICA